jgi:signal transduction histidine kinase
MTSEEGHDPATLRGLLDEARRSAAEALAQARLETVVAEERERMRLAVALHDRLGQTLALAQIRLGLLRETLPAEARAAVDACAELIASAVNDIRSMTFELSPPLLREMGLRAALLALADRLGAQHGLGVAVEGTDPALDTEISAVLFRVARELLVNVVKHGGCAEARVVLASEADFAGVEVIDAGAGFDPAAAPQGFGLASAREQVTRLGGTLEIAAAPGAGVTARVRLPRVRRA